MGITVKKAEGISEPYSEEKIRLSATRVGVSIDLQNEMLEYIHSRLYEGISTHEIFMMIREFLHKSPSPHLAMKYNLKAALAELGPSGYPFEQYIAMLLTAEGYSTKTNQIIMGSCISHEVDVVASKDLITYLIEAKFHQNPSMRTDVKITLYIKARDEDIAHAWKGGELRPWIITNTRFSADAITYGECQNIRLTSWGYPKGEGIADLIERTGLHPITMIDNLSGDLKRQLLAAGVVTCQQLLEPKNRNLIPQDIRDTVLSHVERICHNQV